MQKIRVPSYWDSKPLCETIVRPYSSFSYYSCSILIRTLFLSLGVSQIGGLRFFDGNQGRSRLAEFPDEKRLFFLLTTGNRLTQSARRSSYSLEQKWMKVWKVFHRYKKSSLAPNSFAVLTSELVGSKIKRSLAESAAFHIVFLFCVGWHFWQNVLDLFLET